MSFSYSAASVEDAYGLNNTNKNINLNAGSGSGTSSQPLIQKRKLSNQHKRTLKNKSGLPPIYTGDNDIDGSRAPYMPAKSEGFASINPLDNNLGDFEPLAPPASMSSERIKNAPDAYSSDDLNNSNGSVSNSNSTALDIGNETNTTHDLDQNFMTEEQSKQYYRKLMGNYPPPSSATPIASLSAPTQISNDGNDPVITKLNYLIGLMEEQQAEKTDSVVEDIVLYSFLGVFIIFIVDSFVRVGKYVR